ncbi:MAG: methylmalonyl-CoA mutase family protein [Brumimicrobium sp.]
MSDFFSEFSSVSEQEWLDLVSKDLKGKSIEDVLHHTHPIEELEYKSYAFPNDQIENHETPGSSPYTRGGKFKDNDWEIINVIPKGTPEEMNKLALDYLMKGATGLRLNLFDFDSSACDKLVKGIEFEYISVTFEYHTKEQFDWLTNLAENTKGLKGTAVNSNESKFGYVPKFRNHLIRGTDVQKTGGNVTQEIAYCLNQGHIALFELINSGLSVDDAAAQIKFRLGIGSNYFFEIAKFKVFKNLWHQIVSAYKPTHTCSTIPFIEAETGFLNKSLKDPHNNLLRQTTEALSAILGGVDELTILPYNWKAKQPDLIRSQRLATNIGLLLKEESYLDKVVDPSGGAYSLEEIISTLKKEAWKLFQTIEKEGVETLSNEINRVANKRVELVDNKSNVLIGVNKYFNTDKQQDFWKTPTQTELGKELILELECNCTEA